MGYHVELEHYPPRKSEMAEINFDEEDEGEIEGYLENLEKINEDFLTFNSRIMNQP